MALSNIHQEVHFEDLICNYLANHGWFYQEGDNAHYHKEWALYPPDVEEWIKETQPKTWEQLCDKYTGSSHISSSHTSSQIKPIDIVCKRIREECNAHGTLHVLRDGVDVLGISSRILLMQKKPAFSLNASLLADYRANRLRVVRQVKYSLHNENSIDLVLFVNGLPVATAELKSDYTQSIDHAIHQYREDRQPFTMAKQSKRTYPEPLLTFSTGALVHFAVSHSEVAMTTKLAGAHTNFLPFNRGYEGGKGNPSHESGIKTAYLWQEVWQRESWLDILGRYIIGERKSGKLTGYIFPRYHQLDVTRKLVRAITDHYVENYAGQHTEQKPKQTGDKYLIQHSAGSGKTNSIAWTAYFLSELHHPQTNKKVFDSVLVVSDRNVLDTQLREAIFNLERTKGVVVSITGERDAKSNQLTEALQKTAKIIVCTIQTFPFALEAVQKLAATQNKRFAVIADEAHSSQSNESASKLRQVLASGINHNINHKITNNIASGVLDPNEIDVHAVGVMGDASGSGVDEYDLPETSTEDILVSRLSTNMKGRVIDANRNITYLAFTATPKAKTLELFGDTDPITGKKVPFHVYSMRQAIEEKFILDVLQNYTTYSMLFQLALKQNQTQNTAQNQAHNITELPVEKKFAQQKIMQWVRLHPHNIAQKVQIVVEHFRENVAPLLGGRAKAMVVVSSRKEAVRWKKAISAYILEKEYPLHVLVAFSGEVEDPESYLDSVSETSEVLNPLLKGRDIRMAFDKSEPEQDPPDAPIYHLLLVANKFQTGFDQPLLCGMYIDKRLDGIQAVQTLSRLNRAYSNQQKKLVKDTTYILDFINKEEDILAAFKQYYETAELPMGTDPNQVLTLRSKLDAAGYYDSYEVDRVVEIEMSWHAKQDEQYRQHDKTQESKQEQKQERHIQEQLLGALSPIVDRIHKQFAKAGQDVMRAKRENNIDLQNQAEGEQNAIKLFRADMLQFCRLYSFLSQLVDYGNTEIEKRYIFYRRLTPLLDLGSVREKLDLSNVVLTHYALRKREQKSLSLQTAEAKPIQPVTAAGTGSVREQERALLQEIVRQINDLFSSDVTEQDKILYIQSLNAQLMKNDLLVEQARSNTKDQFAASPDLEDALIGAIVSNFDIYRRLSEEALDDNSPVRAKLKGILLNSLDLYDQLRRVVR